MSEYVGLSTIIEDPLAEVKSELDSLHLFEVINEGEEIYEGGEPWAMVFPGMDRISLEGNQQLRHRYEIYVLFLHGAEDSTLPELRKKAELGYNKLMEDTTHGGTCWHCLPTLWNPGFMQWGEYSFVGVQTLWQVENWQTFPLPQFQGRRYTSMEDIVEKIVAAFKDELEDIPDIDEVTEGEYPYEGQGTIAWVVPGTSTISSVQRARLAHSMVIHQDLISSIPTLTFSEMRQIGQDAYDRLMEDITHNRTVTDCIPTLWHPGFMQFGNQSLVGIHSTWRARILQDYTPT